MSAPYRLYGADLSPYTLKVRSYLRWKGLEHTFLTRSGAREQEFRSYARLPLIPVVVGADESALQDSTPAIEMLEMRHPEPALQPADPALAFLSALLEDWSDEWLNKPMFHFRWTYEADGLRAATAIAEMMLEGQEGVDHAPIIAAIRDRMVARLPLVGSDASTGPFIEASFAQSVDLLNAHLDRNLFLFGLQPCLADFGVYGQFSQLKADPTPAARIAARAPILSAWIEVMDDPKTAGGFASLDALTPTLAPLLTHLARTYLPWMQANFAASSAAQPKFTVELEGTAFEQETQRYAARAFAEIRRKFASVEDAGLAELLASTGCAAFLA